ncbi:zinc-ribbon domain-containing protein [Shewanella schlegeliana]|uniref:Zinc-ribbon domain-containing protein n=1 Tax=Shewanella schlegeliana TaxID=190308 RepID=A0ABS1SVT2_9GAMM|nr:zinc-ribbon domain-containing protein [Shewanella schlegeliana]MBL4912642.1 zinc-ribbon domain-containing protein [Shewanella schlegeliana]MCL1109850.1 zinc-ribbon domain-containing protein [Shewanella schlegeliana]GIU32740.1 hypothetical protein TUM4433_26130 [Shewanella schlegeliana]
MLFLIGMDKKYELIEPSITCNCLCCEQETSWRLYKETEWASLFFIPVWRFTPDYLLVCELCRYEVKLARPLGRQLALSGSYDQDLYCSILHSKVEALVAEHQGANRETSKKSRFE